MNDAAGTDPTLDLPAIPSNGLLLHVGVFKTGTTTLQTTMRASTTVLGKHDVLFRGPSSWGVKPLGSLLDREDPAWGQLEDSIHSASGRAMVSAENMCLFTKDQIARTVARLGADRPVSVLITIRSLTELLPSSWQQDLRNRPRSTPSYEEWLHDTIRDPDQDDSKFWMANNFPRLVGRWGDLIGNENITISVTDKRKPDRILQVTEAKLGIPHGTLQLAKASRTNPSRSFEEAEYLYQLNQTLLSELEFPQYLALIKKGAFREIMQQDPTLGSRIPVPTWAAEQLARVAAEHAEELSSSRATIVGDIFDIARSTSPAAEQITPPTSIPIDVAVAAVVGTAKAASRELAHDDQQPTGLGHKRVGNRLARPVRRLRTAVRNRKRRARLR